MIRIFIVFFCHVQIGVWGRDWVDAEQLAGLCRDVDQVGLTGVKALEDRERKGQKNWLTAQF